MELISHCSGSEPGKRSHVSILANVTQLAVLVFELEIKIPKTEEAKKKTKKIKKIKIQ